MPIEELLRAYCVAFGGRDADAVAALFSDRGLYELPLLGQRLVGPAEIRVGLERAFALIEGCAIEIASVKSSPRVAIAEGRLSAKLHRDAQQMEAPLAIVVECRDERLSRLATHLDARPYRLWSDGPIFAVRVASMAISLQHTICTPRLTLRRMTAADAPRVCEIQSNWNVTRMLRMASFPPTLDGLDDWLALHEGEWLSGTAYRFAVIVEERVIGCADADEISSDAGELGYWLDEHYWGRGLASEAAQAVLNFAFETVGLRRMSSGHAADNPASGRILTKLGFRWIRDTTLWSRSRREPIVQRQYEIASADIGPVRPS